MKKLVFLTCALFSSYTLACTDFSGDYRTEVMTYYSISQNGCESMDVIDESGTQHMVFDGVERLLAEYDIEVEGEILAHVQIFLKSEMKGDKWVYHERDVTKYRSGEVDELKKWAEVSFNEDTDLQTILHHEDGSIETFVDLRNR